MKRFGLVIKQNIAWLGLLLLTDVAFCFFMWLVAPEAFVRIRVLVGMFTVILFAAVCSVLCIKDRKKIEAFRRFVTAPDEQSEIEMRSLCGASEQEYVSVLSEELHDLRDSVMQSGRQLRDYQEYVENWAHEIKTPISLLTFVVDNRRDELPHNVVMKMDNVTSQMQNYVDQMLYYARLKSDSKDYLMESIDVEECVDEVIADYRSLLEEKGIRVRKCLENGEVYSDRRGLQFILGQLVSNSMKYTNEQPEISFDFWTAGDKKLLSVSDNGIGVKSCDMPYIFEKGVTGDSGENRKHATGMGLYLVSEMAHDLGITVTANSKWQNGFEIVLEFPDVETKI